MEDIRVTASAHVRNPDRIIFALPRDAKSNGWLEFTSELAIHLDRDTDVAMATLDRIIEQCKVAKGALAKKSATADAQHKGGNPFHGFSE